MLRLGRTTFVKSIRRAGQVNLRLSVVVGKSGRRQAWQTCFFLRSGHVRRESWALTR